jgi:outer membrane protein
MTAGMVAMAGLMAAPAFAELKIGVLEYSRLMDESPQGKALLESLRNEAAAKQRELQGIAANLQAKQDKLTKDRATMSADQITKFEKDLRDGQRDLARRQSEVQDDFNARRNEEMSKLQRSLIAEVQAYAKSQNFDLVVTDGVIYASQALDITQGVLQVLQSRSGVAAAARPATPAPGAAPAAQPRPPGSR